MADPSRPPAPVTAIFIDASGFLASEWLLTPVAQGVRGACRAQTPAFFSIEVMNALSRSIGTGKIVVELFSVAISASVWR